MTTMADIRQLEDALIKADAAGDTASAKILADEIRKMRGVPQQRGVGEEFLRSVGITARGVAPVALGAGGGALIGGPPGALAGSIALPAAELATQTANVFLPQKYQIPSPATAVENLMTRIGLPQAETTQERMAQAAAGALTGVGTQVATLPTIVNTAKTDLGRRIAENLLQSPGRQIAAAAPAAAVSQGVSEEFGPLAGAGAGAITGGLFSVGARPRVGPTAEDLAAKSSKLFAQAKQSGIAFDNQKFTQNMAGIANNLRQEGYTPTAYPKIDAIVRELTSTTQPKDFTELQALRKIIQNAQASSDLAEKRLATKLKDQFDEYVLNAPQSDVVGTNTKTGVGVWKQARDEYSKMMKADIFEEMLANAALDRSKFTASGAENSMAQQLRNLAKNDNKMRMFTKAEQAEIRAAAKGSTTQNLLKFFGRFAPTGPVSSIFAGGGAVYEPTVGIPFTLGTIAARAGATAMRRQSVERLADMMRLGQVPERRLPVSVLTGTRGLLSPQVPLNVTEEDLQPFLSR